MKRCPNPDCEPAFLFDPSRVVCPFCRTVLVDSAAGAGPGGAAILPPDRAHVREPERREAEEDFLRQSGLSVECHGRISEIEHQELFNSKRHKLANALFRGEPYQLAHQTIEYTIRVEELSEGIPERVTDFCLFGSYLGRLHVGDEVTVRARDLRDRRVVKRIYNRTTGSVVKPGIQIPAWLIRAVLLFAVLASCLLMCAVVYAFRSGLAAAWLKGLLIMCLPTIVMILLAVFFLRSPFRERRH